MSERFIYMPSLGFCFILAVLAYRFGESRKNITVVTIGLVVLMLLFAYKTIDRNVAWESNYTLFTTDVKVSKNSAKLLNAVGGELLAQAVKPENKSRKNSMAAEAKGHLTRALEIHPNYKNAHLLLGNAHFHLEEFDKAEASYSQALVLDPNFVDAINNKAALHEELGKKYGGQGDHARAIKYFEQVIRVDPGNAKVLFFLGSSLRMIGQPGAAISRFEEALSKAANRDNDARIYNEIALSYKALGDEGRAQEYFAKGR